MAGASSLSQVALSRSAFRGPGPDPCQRSCRRHHPDQGAVHPIDVVNVDLSSDGEFVDVAVTLAERDAPYFHFAFS